MTAVAQSTVDFKAGDMWGMLTSSCGRFTLFVGDDGSITAYDRGRLIGAFLFLSDAMGACQQ
jgi:hypothetical protein